LALYKSVTYTGTYLFTYLYSIKKVYFALHRFYVPMTVKRAPEHVLIETGQGVRHYACRLYRAPAGIVHGGHVQVPDPVGPFNISVTELALATSTTSRLIASATWCILH